MLQINAKIKRLVLFTCKFWYICYWDLDGVQDYSCTALSFAWPDTEFLLLWKSTGCCWWDVSRDIMTMLCRSKYWDHLLESALGQL